MATKYTTKEEALEALSACEWGDALEQFSKSVSKKLWKDRAFVLEVVKQNAHVLGILPKYREDREFVLEALKSVNGNKVESILFWAKKYHNDKEVVLVAVSRFGIAFRQVYKWFNAEKEIVLAAVKKFGIVLGLASEGLRADHEVVCAAVADNIHAIKYVLDFDENRKQEFLDAIKQGLDREAEKCGGDAKEMSILYKWVDENFSRIKDAHKMNDGIEEAKKGSEEFVKGLIKE